MKKLQGRPLPLGVSKTKEGINFSIAVEDGSTCELYLYRKKEELPAEKIVLDSESATGKVRAVTLVGIEKGITEYQYRIDGEAAVDPYAISLQNGRSGILPETYDWEDDQPLHIPQSEVIAYSLHVRGFTRHSSSRVKHKGTFLGLVEKIPYLTELGINQIQCMPVYSFGDGAHYTNYWGYGPAYCFAPKAEYAAGNDAVKELKNMVKAFHRAGIEVVLELPFTAETPHLMIQECLRYYVLDYHIDGFVLNEYHAPIEQLKKDPLLSGTKLLKRQDAFQNVMRRFLKGDEGMVPDVMWWLRHLSEADGIFNYITTHTGFTMADLVSYDGKHNEANGEKNLDGPDYNYSWNCGVEGPTRKKAILDFRKQQMRNAFFLLLLSQGTPCILAGDEFANSQKGNNNVYCQDNEISWLNWRNLQKEQELFHFVKQLIAIRKAHPVFRPVKELLGVDQYACGVPDVSYHGESAWIVSDDVASRQLGVYYSGKNAADEDCFIAYNMHWENHIFALPTLPQGKKWYQVLSTKDGNCEAAEAVTDKKVVVDARTIVLFFGR